MGVTASASPAASTPVSALMAFISSCPLAHHSMAPCWERYRQLAAPSPAGGWQKRQEFGWLKGLFGNKCTETESWLGKLETQLNSWVCLLTGYYPAEQTRAGPQTSS